MSLQSVLDKINFDEGGFLGIGGFSDAEKNRMTTAITNLYNGSSTAREILLKMVAWEEGTELDIKKENNKFGAYLTEGTRTMEEGDLLIDLDFLDDLGLLFISNTGVLTAASLERALIHEIIHNVELLSDNANTTTITVGDDVQGDTVRRTNEVMAELGEPEVGRVTYNAVPQVGNASYQTGVSYTQGNTIDIGAAGSPDLDFSTSAVSTNDLLLGTDTSNVLRGGAGDDYLYGFGGRDVLTGGRGNDYIDGGAGNDIVVFNGKRDDVIVTQVNDTTYTMVDQRSGSPFGTDTLVNIERAKFNDGVFELSELVVKAGQNVMLAVDLSGSMGDDLAAVKARATEIVNAIFGSDDAPMGSRLAITFFNDTGSLGTILPFTDQRDIADRKQAALDAIASLSLKGGGLEPLNEAILYGINGGAGDWAAGATANRLIVFSDEPAADPQLRSQVLQALQANQGIAYESELPQTPRAFQGLIYDQPFGQDITPEVETPPLEILSVLIGDNPNAANDFQELAEATGGGVYQAENADEVVDALLSAIQGEPSEGVVSRPGIKFGSLGSYAQAQASYQQWQEDHPDTPVEDVSFASYLLTFGHGYHRMETSEAKTVLPSQYDYQGGLLFGPEGYVLPEQFDSLTVGSALGQPFTVDIALEDFADPDGESGPALSVVDTLQAEISNLYLAYFGRAPDAEGLMYWFKALYSESLTLGQVASGFSNAAEFNATYGNDVADTTLVTAAYQNLLGRTPGEEGLNYWLDRLTTESRESFVLSLAQGAFALDGSPTDRQLLMNKHEVALHYAEQVFLDEDDVFESGINTLLATVTNDPESVARAINAVDTAMENDPLTLTGVLQDEALWNSLL
ncbi:MAG: DUF4214 domain-containing protein [Halomonas sp.]|nr:DUF4214 domain-containing protein [Halomonas sp.]MBL1266191.1 DUF4214 domain-containing protein [Halomonas sp.]